MKLLRFALWANVLTAVLGLGLVPATVQADGDEHGTRVIWDRIVGIVVPGSIVGRAPGGLPCNPGLDCVEGTPAPWTVTAGSAAVNLDQGRLSFAVRGLVLAGDPSFTNLGTPGLITMVKGTLVCNDTEPGVPELVDTDAVALSVRGNAIFHGDVQLPPSCSDEPEDIVFLVRIAEAEPSVLVDLWNAFGAVRIVRNSPE